MKYHHVLKARLEVLIYPSCLLHILRQEMQTFPNIWKSTRVCPILKLGKSSKNKKYRFTAIMCAPAKVMEQILYSHILNHIKSYVTESQHGFFPCKCTTTI
jgi:hypothetical protein